LHGGLGFSGKLCGVLTGGCCVLALHAGRGAPEESEDPRLTLMICDLVAWFEQEYGSQFGGIDCGDILNDDARNKLTRCPVIVMAVSRKVEEILAANANGT
jgi:hypothetical protein